MMKKLFQKRVWLPKQILAIILSVLLVGMQVDFSFAQAPYPPGAGTTPPPVLSGTTNISEQIATLDAEIESLEDDLAADVAQIDANNALIAQYQAELEALGMSAAEDSDVVSYLNAQINTLQGEINTLQGSVNANNAQIAANNSEISGYTAYIASLDTEINNNQAVINSNNAEINANNTTISNYYAQMAQNDTFIAGCNQTINACQSQIDINNNQIAAWQAHINQNAWYEGIETAWLYACIAANHVANAAIAVVKAGAEATRAVYDAFASGFSTNVFNLYARNAQLAADNTARGAWIGLVRGWKATSIAAVTLFNNKNSALLADNFRLGCEITGREILKGAAILAASAAYSAISIFSDKANKLKAKITGLSNANVALAGEVETAQTSLSNLRQQRTTLMEQFSSVSRDFAARKLGFQTLTRSLNGFSVEGYDAEKGFAATQYVYKDGQRTSGLTYKIGTDGSVIKLTAYTFKDGHIDRIVDLTSGKYIQYGEVTALDGTVKYLALTEHDLSGKMIGRYNYTDGKLTSKDVFGVSVEEFAASAGYAPSAAVPPAEVVDGMVLTERILYDSHQKPSQKVSFFMFVAMTKEEKDAMPKDAAGKPIGETKKWKSAKQVEDTIRASIADKSPAEQAEILATLKIHPNGGMITEEYTYQFNESKRDWVFKESTSYSLDSFDAVQMIYGKDNCNNTTVDVSIKTTWSMKAERTTYDKEGNAQYIYNADGGLVGEYSYNNGILASLTRWDKSSYIDEQGNKFNKDITTVIVFDQFGRVGSVNVSGTMDILIDLNSDSTVVDEPSSVQIVTINIVESYVYKYNDTGEMWTNDRDNDGVVDEGVEPVITNMDANGNVVPVVVHIPPGGLMSVERNSHSYGIANFDAVVGCLQKEITQVINEKTQSTDYYDFGKLVSVTSTEVDLTEEDKAIPIVVDGVPQAIGDPGTIVTAPDSQPWQTIIANVVAPAIEIAAWAFYAVLVLVSIIAAIPSAGISLGATFGLVMAGGGFAATLSSAVKSIFQNPTITVDLPKPPSDFNPANPGYSAVSLMPPVEPPAEGPQMMAPIMPNF